MLRSMMQSAGTMNQLQSKLDLIGHNLANLQTPGYKSREAEFSSLLFQQINNMTHPANADGRQTPDGIRVGSGAKLGTVMNDLSMGAIQTTDRPLDAVLLNEHHLFQVEVNESGTRETKYTRDGSFYLNPTANNESVELTSSDGHRIIGQNGPITIAAGFEKVEINPNGEIVVWRNGQVEVADQLAIVKAVRPRLLEEVGENLFQMPNLGELGYNFADVIQNADTDVDLIQSGALEHSNVDYAKQMTDMITAQRSYQFNARSISTGDQMLGLINQLR